MTGPDAERVLRDFARQTNLLLAGRPLRVTGGAVNATGVQATGVQSTEVHATEVLAAELRALGAALGMRPLAPDAADDAHLSDNDSVLVVDIDLAGPTFLVGGRPVPPRDTASERIEFAPTHMPGTRIAARELARVLAGLRIGVALPLEPKTAVLALALADAGAHVSVYGHPDEVDEDVAQELRERGLPVLADASAAGAAERANALKFVQSGLDVLIDDGAHLIRLAHEAAPRAVAKWIGATEETTSGVTAVRVMEAAGALRIPVIAANDAATKTTFDNRYGTGQSCVFAIADALDAGVVGGASLRVRDVPALVIGYGPVGAGVAAYLRALGADVTVAETDPVRGLVAWHDGFPVARAEKAARGALVVSATGVAGTVTELIASRARVIAVAGGVPGEVTLEALATGTPVLGGGGPINLVAGEGNPIEIMDLSFATQLIAVAHLVTARPPAGLHAVPADAVDAVARSAAAWRGVTLGERVDVEADRDWHSPRYAPRDPGGRT